MVILGRSCWAAGSTKQPSYNSIGFEGFWRTAETCQGMSGQELLKRTQLQWGTLAVLEVLVPCNIHQKRQSQWNEAGCHLVGRLCYIPMRLGPKRWVQASQENPKDCAWIPDAEFWILGAVGTWFCLIQILVVHCIFFLELKKNTFFLIL